MLENHLGKLRAFYVTSQEGGFLRAAKRLGLTQPAVTKAVKLLEEQSGVVLFVRHSRGVTLTRQGQILAQFCETLFLKVRDVEKKLTSKEGRHSGVVRIGTYESLGVSFWPAALRQLHRSHPQLVIELTTENPQSHLQKLESGGIDIVVDAEPPMKEQLFTKVLYTDHFGIFMKKGFKTEIGGQPTPISYVRGALDRHGRAIGEQLASLDLDGCFDYRYAVETFSMVRSLVLEGICAGVLPLRLASKYMESGRLLCVKIGKKSVEFGEHRICATCLTDLKGEPNIVAAIAALRECSKLEN
jgi:DNA-binding transcriptional LysR family regulator